MKNTMNGAPVGRGMSASNWMCNVATTFHDDGRLDEPSFRSFLQRFAENGIGIYLASGGSGEGHALSKAETRRVYEIGVEICKGKVPVHSNSPEQHLPDEMIEHALLAAECGIEVVGVYGPAGWHSFRPTDAELVAFYNTVLKAVRHPVELNTNPTLGYIPKAEILADICHRFPQVTGIKMPAGVPENYLLDIKQALKRDVAIYVMAPGTISSLMLGATGILGSEANIIPRTYKKASDLFNAKRFDEFVPVYGQCRRFIRYVGKWQSSNPRWLKMCFRVLKMPGAGLRPPYLMPDEKELRTFAEGLAKLDIPELDEQVRAAGLA